MPRRVEDIVPNKHRTIRDVPVSAGRASRGGREVSVHKVAVAPLPKDFKEPKNPPRKTRRGGKRRFGLIWKIGGAVVILAALAYLVSTYMSRAIFNLSPREVPISVSGTYVFSATPKDGNLTYKVLNESDTASVSVPAVDGPAVEAKAHGTMTVYNSYSEQARRLIAGTRFDQGDGRVYRLTGSIMVPGYTKDSGGGVIPGHINAPIVADQAGQTYDIASHDPSAVFKIVAYKGTDKYDTMYGKLATDVVGGQSGHAKKVDPAVLASTTEALKAALSENLRNRVTGDIPDGYIVYDAGYIPSFGTVQIGGADTGTAEVSLKGTMYAVAMNKAELIAKLATPQDVSSFKDMPYDASGMENLSFSISNAKEFSPASGNTMIAALKGNMKLIGRIPTDELKAKFAGLSLSETQKIITGYAPVIDLDKSSGQVVPPWSKVPSDPAKVSIIVSE